MCIFVPEGKENSAALKDIAMYQDSVMERALAKWTEQDWSDAELAVTLTDEEYAAFARSKGWE